MDKATANNALAGLTKAAPLHPPSSHGHVLSEK